MSGRFSVGPFGRAGAPARRLNILVADDDPDTVATLAALLESEGHQVRGVHRSTEVLGAADELKPDVVILDLQMPEVSGYDLARWLRSRHGKRCPVLIAVTGVDTRPSDKQISLLSGFDYYVMKPYYVGDLLSLTLQAAHAQMERARSGQTGGDGDA